MHRLRKLREVCRRLYGRLSGESGFTLLEVVVAMTFAGVGTAAVTTLLATGIISGGTVTDRTTGTLIARAQVESVLSNPYMEGGPYAVIPGLPADIQVAITVDPLIPQYLQRVTVTVQRRTAGSPTVDLARLSTFKSNRFLTTGGRPSAGGLQVVHSLLIPDLSPGDGMFQTVSVIPSATKGQIGARWQLAATPPTGLSTEARSISVTVYQGTPFGVGSGISTLTPSSVTAPTVASGNTTDVVLEALSDTGVTSQTYTVYFYNADSVGTATTVKARIVCICPDL